MKPITSESEAEDDESNHIKLWQKLSSRRNLILKMQLDYSNSKPRITD